MAKLIKTIRFDSSDENVFHHAATEEEWAISCAFQFCDLQWEELDGKTRQAFNNGFLGLSSFGFSTFASVCTIADTDLTDVEMTLARYILENHGAPNLGSALGAAKEEIAYAVQLCQDVPENTVFAVKREFSVDGRIKEAFHTVDVDKSGCSTGNMWASVEDD